MTQTDAAVAIVAMRRQLGDVRLIEAFIVAMAIEDAQLQFARVKMTVTYPPKPKPKSTSKPERAARGGRHK